MLALSACSAPRDRSAPPTGPEDGLRALRSAAALPACPGGLGPALPDLTLPCLSGGPAVALRASGPSRPRLVNIWATWCAPCVREVPELVAFADQARGQVDVVGVLTQDEQSLGLEFARQFAMNYTSVVDDDGAVLRRFSPGPPTSLFLSEDGTLAFVQRGEIKDAAALRALVREHLGFDVPG